MIRRIRLATGLILFAYVLTHFLNHAVGIYSLRAAVGVEQVFRAFWGFPVSQAALYGSLLAHMLLALWSLLQHRRLRDIRPAEGLQFVLGLAIPALILEHVVGTRGAQQLVDLTPDYVSVVLVLWVAAPFSGVVQTVALLAAWIHGCLGLHGWLRLKPHYQRVAPWLLGVAILVPTAALAGFSHMGRELAAIAADDEAFARLLQRVDFPSEQELLLLVRVMNWTFVGLGALLAATIVGRFVLLLIARRRRKFRVHYAAGQAYDAPIGFSILDVSRANDVPHAHVCGGRGRCSTCRIRVGEGIDDLPPPDEDEQRVLERIGAPPNVRLACQTHPTREVHVTPLLPPVAMATAGHQASSARHGQERALAVLFADMRGFTSMSENRLPYDLVFILNRYFRAMGSAVEAAGGHLDKFIGDGVMALFGVDGDLDNGCHQAVNAARMMAENLRELNASLGEELKRPLRVGIGINVGPAIVGEMGYARAIGLTAIGDAVNTASRLESMTKEYRADLIMARTVADRIGLDVTNYVTDQVTVRGRKEPMDIVIVPNAAYLPAIEVPGAPAPGGGARSRRHSAVR